MGCRTHQQQWLRTSLVRPGMLVSMPSWVQLPGKHAWLRSKASRLARRCSRTLLALWLHPEAMISCTTPKEVSKPAGQGLIHGGAPLYVTAARHRSSGLAR